jgi:hypothetical protein
MRKRMQGLSLLVQESLSRDPFAADVSVFRRRSDSLIKALWHDKIGCRLIQAIRPWAFCLAGDGGPCTGHGGFGRERASQGRRQKAVSDLAAGAENGWPDRRPRAELFAQALEVIA